MNLVRFGSFVKARLVVGLSCPGRRDYIRRVLPPVLLAGLVCAAGIAAFHSNYRVGIDFSDVRCFPERVYFITLGGDRSPARDAVVAYIAPVGLMRPQFDNRLIVKQVAGIAGDRISVQHDRVYVNGTYKGELILNAKLGKRAGDFDREQVVPAGKIFVMGTMPRSYDSRYWGFLDTTTVIGHATPLF